MPFGLKITGATYQRLVNKILPQQISWNIEAYVNDLLVKSEIVSTFIFDLREVFQVLSNSPMLLNPKKCIFNMKSGKFLGYLVSSWEIEANLDKVNAIRDMTLLRSVKDVQKLVSRLVVLNPFLSKSSQCGLLFFKTSKKVDKFKWDSQCQETFDQLNDHLMSLPMLISLTSGETLFMYLAMADEAISVVLIKEQSIVQHLVYYVSRALHGPCADITDPALHGPCPAELWRRN